MKTKSKYTFSAAFPLVFAALAASSIAGSLWREGITDERGMFADKRAKRVGDIVTIVVQETASVSNSVRLKTDKDAKSSVIGAASNVLNQFLGNIPKHNITKEIQKNLQIGRASCRERVCLAV